LNAIDLHTILGRELAEIRPLSFELGGAYGDRIEGLAFGLIRPGIILLAWKIKEAGLLILNRRLCPVHPAPYRWSRSK
jgi:hypothetical protein